MLEELIARSFAVRNAAHLAHWRAKGEGSYARHVALGDFYDGLMDKLDGIVEAHQGLTSELVSIVKLDAQDTKRDIIGVLRSESEWLAKNRSTIANKNPAIENMVDDLAGLYLSAIYKLTFMR